MSKLEIKHTEPPCFALLDREKRIPANIYPVIDTDLARDNLENDIPEADLRDS